MMKAIILAAGEGVRMRPLTLTTPKPLIKAGGKPLIEHLVSKFPEKIDELVIVVGYLGEQIEKYCGDHFLGRPVRYVKQEKKLGTYQALELCRPLLRENEPFFVFYADDLIDAETIRLLADYPLAIVCKHVADPRRFGVATLNNDGTVADIVEKPTKPVSNLAMASGLKLNADIFRYPPDRNQNGEYYLSVAIAKMAKEHEINVVEANFWVPLGTPEDIEQAEKEGLV